jgi:hypothetical protein
MQPIDISTPRTFQEATKEPLGEDWGAAELQGLRAAQGKATAAVRRSQSNACPEVARMRHSLAVVERTVTSLPSEERQELLQAIEDLRGKAERAQAEAQLPLTAVRAGKVVRRQQGRKQQGRSETDRTVKALHPGRKGGKRGTALILEGGSGVEQSDDFPRLAKKGKAVDKVRGARSRACAAACGGGGGAGQQMLCTADTGRPPVCQ